MSLVPPHRSLFWRVVRDALILLTLLIASPRGRRIGGEAELADPEAATLAQGDGEEAGQRRDAQQAWRVRPQDGIRFGFSTS
jgi:hypothetical protein